jgi:hypothetical protein
LLPVLTQPGLSVLDALKAVRKNVIAKAGSVHHDQHPAFYDQTDGEFYLVPGRPAVDLASTSESGNVPSSTMGTALPIARPGIDKEEEPRGRVEPSLAGGAFAADPTVGTWKLNVAKSKFNEGAPWIAETRVYTEANGVFTLEVKVTGTDGGERASQVKFSDGKESKEEVTGVSWDTINAKKVSANTWDFDLKRDGKVVGHVHHAISADGRTLTVHNTGSVYGVRGSGGETLVFERQPQP